MLLRHADTTRRMVRGLAHEDVALGDDLHAGEDAVQKGENC